MSQLYLGAYWKYRSLTMREFVNRTRRFLSALGEAHPAFRDLREAGSKPDDEIRLETDLGNLEALVSRRGYDPKGRFSEVCADGSPSMNSTSATGFRITLKSQVPVHEGGVVISINDGIDHPKLKNSLVIELPVSGYPEFHQKSFICCLLGIVVECWTPFHALVTTREFRSAIEVKGSTFSVGWLSYIADKRVAPLIPPGIHYEQFGGEGVLIALSEEVSSPKDVSVLARAMSLRERITAGGFAEIPRRDSVQ